MNAFKPHTALKSLYHGNSTTASRFRFAMLILNIVVIERLEQTFMMGRCTP